MLRQIWVDSPGNEATMPFQGLVLEHMPYGLAIMRISLSRRPIAPAIVQRHGPQCPGRREG